MTQPVRIDAAKLLEAAQDFADHHGGGRGRPRPIWLRRSISSAYYALYHHLSQGAAHHLIPNAKESEQLGVSRSFSHSSMKEVCEWVSGRRGKPPGDVAPIIKSLSGTTIPDVAAAFCDLQEARHRADYDSLAAFSKATADGYIQDALKAIATVDASPETDREMLFALMALKTSIRR